MKKILSTVLLMATVKLSIAQRITIQEYIETYKDLAVKEMKRTGIPASITLAQGILEAEAGNSDLVKRSNNHFGIKCKTGWSGDSVRHDDDEKQECFRKYATAYESYIDHSDFLKNSTRYASLFTLEATDYAGWARGLKRAGYATNPRYADILINNIEKYSLHQFDNFIADDVANATKMVVEEAVVMKNGMQEEVSISPASENVDPAPKHHNMEVGRKAKINGIKATYAKKGTSLLALASNFNIQLGKLMEYNDLDSDGLLAHDQVIYLEKKNKEGRDKTYTPDRTETLRNISQSLGIQLNNLLSFNNLQPDDAIQSGTVIFLKPRS